MSTNPLDSLWDEIAVPSTPVMRVGKPAPAAKIHGSVYYSAPEYWIATTGVALIHEETNTLLGNYQEYRHKHDKGARRLVRTLEPIPITRKELVRGAAWEHIERIIPSPAVSTFTREAVLAPLPLAALGVFTPSATLRVVLQWGGVLRAELTEHTTFHSPDSRSVLTLAAGTNVYECLDLDAKINLKQELAL